MVSGTHAREADRIRSRSRVLVLVNPLASERHPGLAIALATAASELDLLMPRGVDAGLQFRAAAEMVETGVDAVVVCGGDGTVAAGLALTAGTGIPLGIVPAGTGTISPALPTLSAATRPAAWPGCSMDSGTVRCAPARLMRCGCRSSHGSPAPRTCGSRTRPTSASTLSSMRVPTRTAICRSPDAISWPCYANCRPSGRRAFASPETTSRLGIGRPLSSACRTGRGSAEGSHLPHRLTPDPGQPS